MYLSDVERNCKIITLRVTEFDAPTVSCNDISELCGDWQFLREIVGEIVNRLGPSAGLVEDALNGGRQ
jgi:hypothetical protein